MPRGIYAGNQSGAPRRGRKAKGEVVAKAPNKVPTLRSALSGEALPRNATQLTISQATQLTTKALTDAAGLIQPEMTMQDSLNAWHALHAAGFATWAAYCAASARKAIEAFNGAVTDKRFQLGQ